jgi:hypothetical protein
LESIKNFPESIIDLDELLDNKDFILKALRVNTLIVSPESEIDDMEILLIASKWHKLIKEVKTFNLNFKFE